jgi:hypothetical protein
MSELIIERAFPFSNLKQLWGTSLSTTIQQKFNIVGHTHDDVAAYSFYARSQFPFKYLLKMWRNKLNEKNGNESRVLSIICDNQICSCDNQICSKTKIPKTQPVEEEELPELVEPVEEEELPELIELECFDEDD